MKDVHAEPRAHLFSKSILDPTMTHGIWFMPQKFVILS